MKRNCSFTDRVLHLSLLNTYTKGLFDSFIRTPWLVRLSCLLAASGSDNSIYSTGT